MNMYLHFHHRAVREASVLLIAPLFTGAKSGGSDARVTQPASAVYVMCSRFSKRVAKCVAQAPESRAHALGVAAMCRKRSSVTHLPCDLRSALIVRAYMHALMHAAPQVAESRRKTFAKALAILDSHYLHDRPYLAGAHPRASCAFPTLFGSARSPALARSVGPCVIHRFLPSTPSAFDLFLNFSCPGTEMSLADLACYSELGQLLPQYQNLWDFRETPNVQKWCSRMAAVPYHEDVMLSNKLLGDGSALLASGQPFAKETMVMANKEVLDCLQPPSPPSPLFSMH